MAHQKTCLNPMKATLFSLLYCFWGINHSIHVNTNLDPTFRIIMKHQPNAFLKTFMPFPGESMSQHQMSSYLLLVLVVRRMISLAVIGLNVSSMLVLLIGLHTILSNLLFRRKFSALSFSCPTLLVGTGQNS